MTTAALPPQPSVEPSRLEPAAGKARVRFEALLAVRLFSTALGLPSSLINAYAEHADGVPLRLTLVSLALPSAAIGLSWLMTERTERLAASIITGLVAAITVANLLTWGVTPGSALVAALLCVCCAVFFGMRLAQVAWLATALLLAWYLAAGQVRIPPQPSPTGPLAELRLWTTTMTVSGIMLGLVAAVVGGLERSTRALGATLDRERTSASTSIAEQSRSHSLLRAAMDATADGLLIVDRTGKVQGANRQFFEMWRIPESLAMSSDDRLLLDFVLEQLADPEAFGRRVRDLYASPSAGSTDTLIFTDGRQFERVSRPQFLGNEVVGRVWSFRDVTERQRVATALAEQTRLLALTQKISHVGSWSLSAPEEPAIWSEETFDLFGVPPTFVPTRREVEALIRPSDRPRLRAWLGDLLAGRRPERLEPIRVIRPNGTERELAGDAEAIATGGAGTARLIGYCQDVTDVRLHEAHLREAQKLEAVGMLASGIAHDFGNLLTVVGGRASVLRRVMREDDPLCADVVEIENAAQRASALTRRLTAFTRQQVLQPTMLQVNQVVADLQPLLGLMVGDQVQLDVELGEGLGLVRMDRSQLEQVLINLTVNARDAMPETGRLNIRTRNVAVGAGEGRQGGPRTPGRYVAMSVTDTGAGMDETTRLRIFDPFFTTKPPGQGSGLGLSVVHGIVSQSGGYVEVESRIGAGTQFDVYLPVIAETTDGLKGPAAPA